GRDDDGVTVLAQAVGQLADRRRLAGAVHADDEQDARLAGEVDARRLAEEVGDFVGERLVKVRQVAARLEPADELSGRGDADVAGDQRLLEPLPRGGVAGIESRGGDLLRERAPTSAEGVAKAREEAGPLLARFGVRHAVAEQLSPGPRHGAEQ